MKVLKQSFYLSFYTANSLFLLKQSAIELLTDSPNDSLFRLVEAQIDERKPGVTQLVGICPMPFCMNPCPDGACPKGTRCRTTITTLRIGGRNCPGCPRLEGCEVESCREVECTTDVDPCSTMKCGRDQICDSYTSVITQDGQPCPGCSVGRCVPTNARPIEAQCPERRCSSIEPCEQQVCPDGESCSTETPTFFYSGLECEGCPVGQCIPGNGGGEIVPPRDGGNNVCPTNVCDEDPCTRKNCKNGKQCVLKASMFEYQGLQCEGCAVAKCQKPKCPALDCGDVDPCSERTCGGKKICKTKRKKYDFNGRRCKGCPIAKCKRNNKNTNQENEDPADSDDDKDDDLEEEEKGNGGFFGEGACGPTICTRGEVCCNESCGICTPPGGQCITLFCNSN